MVVAASACGHGVDTIEDIVAANTQEAYGRSCAAGIHMAGSECWEGLGCNRDPAAVSKDAWTAAHGGSRAYGDSSCQDSVATRRLNGSHVQWGFSKSTPRKKPESFRYT